MTVTLKRLSLGLVGLLLVGLLAGCLFADADQETTLNSIHVENDNPHPYDVHVLLLNDSGIEQWKSVHVGPNQQKGIDIPEGPYNDQRIYIKTSASNQVVDHTFDFSKVDSECVALQLQIGLGKTDRTVNETILQQTVECDYSYDG